jgi:tight adherence protein C
MPLSITLSTLVAQHAATAISLLIFLAVTLVTFGIMRTYRVRGDVRRRSSAMAVASGPAQADERSLRHASRVAAHRLVDYVTRYYSSNDAGAVRTVRQQMIQAGFLSPRAPALFFIARAAAAAALTLTAFVLLSSPLAGSQFFWPAVWTSALLGYLLPKLYLSRRIAGRVLEHRSGFPDFMDLLVVCADAGLSMEAALDRVGRELHDSYPSLSANIYMATLEIRAGKTLSASLEHLGDRLGLPEARAFATLLQQSEELGSSLTDTLRVYSDDMRHKRLSRAEEKAYSLPAKLSVPLTLCVFPVIIVVILLPVIVRIKTGTF